MSIVDLEILTAPEVVPVTTTTRSKVVRGTARRNLTTFLMVFGPGLIVMEADNDSGAVSTYTQAGAQYGSHLLWTLALLLPICYFVQEMVARLGVATGQGHAAMIYRRFGKWWGLFSLCDLLVVNFLTLVTEFAAISLALSKVGVSSLISVPAAATALGALVLTGSYLKWERIVIALCILDVAWFGLSAWVGPNWGASMREMVLPSLPKDGLSGDLVFLIVAIVGTTIAPWQLFFQQSCVADKRLRFSDLRWERLDTFIGAIFTTVVAGTMMLVGDAAYRHHLSFTDPAQMAVQLEHLYGPWVKNGLLLMMCNAAILGGTAISLSSAWAYGEVKGWPHSLHKKPKEAPAFYSVYGACVIAAAGIVLIPRAPLQVIIIGVQVLAGLILPPALVFLQLLLNDKELLDERFLNRPWQNIVNWTIVFVLFILSFVLVGQVALPIIFPHLGS